MMYDPQLNIVLIEGLDRAELLAALYNSTVPYFGLNPIVRALITQDSDLTPMTTEQAREILGGRTCCSIDYLQGRPIKINFTDEDQIDVSLYNRDNAGGKLLAQRIILHLQFITRLRSFRSDTYEPILEPWEDRCNVERCLLEAFINTPITFPTNSLNVDPSEIAAFNRRAYKEINKYQKALRNIVELEKVPAPRRSNNGNNPPKNTFKKTTDPKDDIIQKNLNTLYAMMQSRFDKCDCERIAHPEPQIMVFFDEVCGLTRHGSLSELGIEKSTVIGRIANCLDGLGIAVTVDEEKQIITFSVPTDRRLKKDNNIAKTIDQAIRELVDGSLVVQKRKLLEQINQIEMPTFNFAPSDIADIYHKILATQSRAEQYLSRTDSNTEVSDLAREISDGAHEMLQTIKELETSFDKNKYEHQQQTELFLGKKTSVSLDLEIDELKQLCKELNDLAGQCRAKISNFCSRHLSALDQLKKNLRHLDKQLQKLDRAAEEQRRNEKAEIAHRIQEQERQKRLLLAQYEESLEEARHKKEFKDRQEQYKRDRNKHRKPNKTEPPPIVQHTANQEFGRINLTAIRDDIFAKTIILSELPKIDEIPEVKRLCYLFNLLKVGELWKKVPGAHYIATQFRDSILYGGWEVDLEFIGLAIKKIDDSAIFQSDDRPMRYETFATFCPDALRLELEKKYNNCDFSVIACTERIRMFLQMIYTIKETNQSYHEAIYSPLRIEALLMAMIYIGVQMKKLREMARRDSNADPQTQNYARLVLKTLASPELKEFFICCNRYKTTFAHEENSENPDIPVLIDAVISASIAIDKILDAFNAAMQNIEAPLPHCRLFYHPHGQQDQLRIEPTRNHVNHRI